MHSAVAGSRNFFTVRLRLVFDGRARLDGRDWRWAVAQLRATANFTFNGNGGGIVLLDFLTSSFLGTGFHSAIFQLSLNGRLLVNKPFFDLASAQAFFSNDLFNISLSTGPYNIELAFSEVMSGGQGFSLTTHLRAAAFLPPPYPRHGG
jgi:hypothetical protein